MSKWLGFFTVSGVWKKEGRKEGKKEGKEKEGDLPSTKRFKRYNNHMWCIELVWTYSNKSIVKRNFETIGDICLWNRNDQEMKLLLVHLDVIMAFVITYENVIFILRNSLWNTQGCNDKMYGICFKILQ